MPDQNHFALADATARLEQLAADWSASTANERASFQTWLIRFCEALGVATPDPPTDDSGCGPWTNDPDVSYSC